MKRRVKLFRPKDFDFIIMHIEQEQLMSIINVLWFIFGVLTYHLQNVFLAYKLLMPADLAAWLQVWYDQKKNWT